jgi:hypothetical protein
LLLGNGILKLPDFASFSAVNSAAKHPYRQQSIEPANRRSRKAVHGGGTSPNAAPAANATTSQWTCMHYADILRLGVEQVYEAWMKCIMNPFYASNQPVTSPVFRSRVSTAAKKYL